MKTYITFKENFEIYLKQCKQYLEEFEKIKPPQKIPIPEFTEDVKWKGYAYIETDRINQQNSKNKSFYELAQKEIEQGRKNLASLMNSPTKFGLIIYNQIYTINQGKVNLKKYIKYLKIGLKTINQELSD
ncbi:MAG: hypothetical protein ABFQ65_02335 [Nanoarchaeota archaeon]